MRIGNQIPGHFCSYDHNETATVRIHNGLRIAREWRGIEPGQTKSTPGTVNSLSERESGYSNLVGTPNRNTECFTTLLLRTKTSGIVGS
jgi:hypothetical protein